MTMSIVRVVADYRKNEEKSKGKYEKKSEHLAQIFSLDFFENISSDESPYFRWEDYQCPTLDIDILHTDSIILANVSYHLHIRSRLDRVDGSTL